MNNEKNIKILNLSKDINEIVELLKNPYFDRNKAQEIIKKHNLSNEKVAAFNSPLNPTYVRFEHSTDDMMKNNIVFILEILKAELAEELSKKVK